MEHESAIVPSMASQAEGGVVIAGHGLKVVSGRIGPTTLEKSVRSD